MASELVLAPGYEPFAKQVEFHRSGKRFKVAAAGNRGGKTKAGAAEFCCNIYRDLKAGKGKAAARVGSSRIAKLEYWVVTPTHDLAKYAYDEIVRFLPHQLIEKVNGSTREMWLAGDIHVDFKSAERPERLVGASLNGLWVDEACLVKEGAWEQNLRARLADQQGWAIFTSTPEGGRANWIYQQLVSQAGSNEHVAAFHWTTEDNPHVPRAEIEHARNTTSPEWFARKWCASWDSFGGAIYPEFNESVHVTTEERLRFELNLGNRPWRECFTRRIGGIDFGHASPGCLIVIGEIGDGVWVVLDEFYSVGVRPLVGSSRTWFGECQRVMKDFGVTEFVGDPGGGGDGHIFDLRNNGIPIRSASKAVTAGISRVAGALHTGTTGRPRMRILNTCRNLIREMRTYQWKQAPNGTDFVEEVGPNQDDHACDALRYAAMELRLYDYVQQQRTGGGSVGRPIG